MYEEQRRESKASRKKKSILSHSKNLGEERGNQEKLSEANSGKVRGNEVRRIEGKYCMFI